MTFAKSAVNYKSVFVIDLSLVKNSINLEVEKGAISKKQYQNKKPEKSREISRW